MSNRPQVDDRVLRVTQNLEAEQSTLGSMLLDSKAAEIALSILRPEDFYRLGHQRIFDAMKAITERGEPVDLVTVVNELRKSNLLESAGGAAYLASLPDAVPTAANAEYHARIVEEKARFRRLRDAYEAGLEALHRGEADWETITSPVREALSLSVARSHLQSLRCLSDVEPEDVSWLWYPYIPIGKLTLFEGDPGLGKSWITLSLATAISRGIGLPGMEQSEPANVLLFCLEDGLADTVRPRLDAFGADTRFIHAHEGILTLDAFGLAQVKAEIEHLRPRLVVIDPILAYVGSKVDIHRSNEVRQITAALAELAAENECAILGVRHLNKGLGGKAIYRGIGSIDFTAAARSVLLAGEDQNSGERAIIHTKSNLAPMGDAVGYELRDDCLYWTGSSPLTASRILAAASSDEEYSALTEAVAFLEAELADGPMDNKEVKEKSRKLGISLRTLERAKTDIGVESIRRTEAGRRGVKSIDWALPAGTTSSEDGENASLSDLDRQKDLDRQPRHIEKLGDLNEVWRSKSPNGAAPVSPDLDRQQWRPKQEEVTTELII